MRALLWIAAGGLAVAGIVALFWGSVVVAVVLIAVGPLVGSGGVSIFS